MLKVALFSGNYNYLREGANQALNILVRYLEEKAGFTVRVYSPVTDTPAFEPCGTLVPVPSVALPVRSEFRLALGLPEAIRDDIRHFRPDIVHVSTPDILDVRAQTFARRLKIPVVASLHTLFETYLDYYGLGWARPLAEAHLRRFYRRSDHVLAPTATLVDWVKEIRADECVSLWSRGVDSDLFRPDRRDMAWRRSRGIADDEVAILFLGRLVAEKGIGTYVSVIRQLEGRGVRVRPLVVGAGPAGGLFDTIPGAVLTGHLSGGDLARAVASADILLYPSATEAFGNVILEAMACGLPVVSADAQSARNLLRDGESGFLRPRDDIAGFVVAIEALNRSPALRTAIGAAARRAAEGHSWEAASASVEGVYRSLYRPKRSVTLTSRPASGA